MDKNKKINKKKLAVILLVAADYFFLSRFWALIVLLIASVPVRDNWHIYCLAIGVPILLISLVISISLAIKKEEGRVDWGIDIDIEEDENQTVTKAYGQEE